MHHNYKDGMVDVTEAAWYLQEIFSHTQVRDSGKEGFHTVCVLGKLMMFPKTHKRMASRISN